MRASRMRAGAARAIGCAFAVALAAAAEPARADAEAPLAATQATETRQGIDVSASVTGVVQQVDAAGSGDGERQSRGNYRGDVTVTLPGGSWGDVEGKLFAHFRAGQGRGVTLRPTFTGTPNSTAFQTAAGPDDAYAIVAQAWYQLTVPLPAGGSKPNSRERLEITGGKIDPFLFFDQNAAADDETVRFLNNAFVHNPLLDSGGDVGADRHGFTPGLRIAYVSERDQSDSWGVSLGVFGSGPDADFTGNPFVIAQVEATRRVFPGRPGTYRLYAWHNGRVEDYTGATGSHSGLGVSVDQRVGDAVTLFTRFGGEMRGRVRFDRVLTLGAEVGGEQWSRAADAIGVAAGFLRTSGEYREATADGAPAGDAASGAERIAEIYYRWRINEHFDVSPDVQWIRRPGGDGSASTVFVAGVRARVAR
jgi:carbohydrate-selective porin OprB